MRRSVEKVAGVFPVEIDELRARIEELKGELVCERVALERERKKYNAEVVKTVMMKKMFDPIKPGGGVAARMQISSWTKELAHKTLERGRECSPQLGYSWFSLRCCRHCGTFFLEADDAWPCECPSLAAGQEHAVF